MKEEWLLSFSDLFTAFKRHTKRLLLCALVFSLLFFLYALQKQTRYTAEAIFHAPVTISKNDLATTLQAVLGASSQNMNEDVRALLNSSAVLDLVVKNQALQATLDASNHENIFTRIKNNIKTETAYFQLLFSKPPSSILDKHIRVPAKEMGTRNALPVICREVIYERNTSLKLNIVFDSVTDFSVSTHELIGKGKIGEPFCWNDIRFVLLKNGKGPSLGNEYALHLLPASAITKSLQRQLKIKFEKAKPSLVRIIYRHPDADLAARIVNEVMYSYHEYLHRRGEKAMESQLAFLEKRKNESHKAFQQVALGYKEYLQEHIEKKNLLSTDEDLTLLSEKQRTCFSSLAEIVKEMNPSEQGASTAEVLQKVRAWEKENPHLAEKAKSMTYETVKSGLESHQRELEKLLLEQACASSSLEKIEDPLFDISSLATTLSTSSLEPHFKKIDSLNFKLHDKSNWTQKEQLCFREELELEKAFLKTYLTNLVEGSSLRQKVLQEKIKDLKEMTLWLLLKSYDETSLELKNLSAQMENLPGKWVQEENLNFQKKMHSELLESISKAAHAKNLAFHMQSFDSSPLHLASVAPLPDSPHLMLSFIFGAFTGVLLSATVILFVCIYEGPSATRANLKAMGFCVVEKQELEFILSQRKGKFHTFTSHAPLLSTKGKIVAAECDYFVVHPTNEKLVDFLPYKEKGIFVFPKEKPLRLSDLQPMLKKLLAKFKFFSASSS